MKYQRFKTVNKYWPQTTEFAQFKCLAETNHNASERYYLLSSTTFATYIINTCCKRSTEMVMSCFCINSQLAAAVLAQAFGIVLLPST